MKACVCGISGRMGMAVFNVLRERGHVLAAAFEREGSRGYGQDAGLLVGGVACGVRIGPITESAVALADVVIDFSSPSASLACLDAASAAGKPIVIGTTGFSQEERVRIERAAGRIPLVLSPNMSLGVNLLFKLTEIAARTLAGYDVEIFEAHHRRKKDAPSGTAIRLLEAVKSAGPLRQGRMVTGRTGITGERSSDEIGVLAMRGGDIVGEHTVYFVGEGERLELTHRAGTRDTFARGAVAAAEFLIGKKPGLYTMFDVLGI